MKQLADGLYLLRGFPPNAINVYLLHDVLIDAGTRQAEGRIMRQIRGHEVNAHALTHAHPDHQGSSHAICGRLDIPLWCGHADVRAMQTPGAISNSQAPSPINRFQARFWTGPPHPVARALKEGDEVAGFAVLETPGHSIGHVAFWRESDRVLILGDVLNGMNLMTGIRGLREPPTVFTPDPSATAGPRAGSRRWSPSSFASVTGRRCATRSSCATSSHACPPETDDRRQHLHRRRRPLPPDRARRGRCDPRAHTAGRPALVASTFERIEPGAELHVRRVSLHPIPLAPLTSSRTSWDLDVACRSPPASCPRAARDRRAGALRLTAAPDEAGAAQAQALAMAPRCCRRPAPELTRAGGTWCRCGRVVRCYRAQPRLSAR